MQASGKVDPKEDPRVRRTRALLMSAFTEALAEEGFHQLSVQAIAERAGINRVSFYGHFSDKYALLEYWLREQFQQRIAATFLAPCPVNAQNLQALLVTIMQWCEELHARAKPEDRQLLPLFFSVMPEELSRLLRAWFSQTPTRELRPHVTLEAAVLVMSWAIIGTSFHWSDGVKTLSLEALAQQVATLLLAGL
jgi:AcrR family transcriptional regulator